ncbi:MAG: hypothetical protein AAFP84_16545 [Actinomycetota bacterium]
MSRITVVNVVLGVVAAALVGILIWQETSDDAPPPTTTTTSTTTTTLPPTTTTSTTTTTTSTTTTSTTTSTTPPPSTQPPVERALVPVVVVNGTTAGELLAPSVVRIQERGYPSVRGLNSQARLTETMIFVRTEEFLPEADVLALDLGFDPADIEIGVFEDAPRVSGLADAQVMVFLGADGLPDPPPVPELDGDGDGDDEGENDG